MKSFISIAAITTLAALAAAQSSTTSTMAVEPTEVTGCHLHGETPYCFAESGDEWEVEDVEEADLADAYTDCHLHDTTELHCAAPEDVTLTAAVAFEEEDHSESATPTTSSTATSSATAAEITAVTDCHLHGETPYCFAASGDEWEVEDVEEADLADAYTDCHLHDADELHCSSPEEVILAAATTEHEDGEEDTTEDTATPRASAEPSAETQAAGSLASATEVSGALVMLSAAVAALYAF